MSKAQGASMRDRDPALWVSRRPGKPSGAPKASYDTGALRQRLPELVRRIRLERPEPIDYNLTVRDYSDSGDFAADELFQHGVLRQGWGLPGLDLQRAA